MKRLILSCFVLTSLCGNAQGPAIETSIPNLLLGVYGGPQRTFLYNRDDIEADQINYDPTYGSSLGLSIGWMLSTKSTLETGLVFSEQGQKYSGEYTSTAYPCSFALTPETYTVSYNSTIFLNYLKLPLLVTHNLNHHNRIGFYGKYGIQFAILRSASLVNKYESFGSSTYTASDNLKESMYTNTAMEALLSLGTRLRLHDKFMVNIGITTSASLNNVEDKDSYKNNYKWHFPIGNPLVVPKYEDSDVSLSRPKTTNIAIGSIIGLTYIAGNRHIGPDRKRKK